MSLKSTASLYLYSNTELDLLLAILAYIYICKDEFISCDILILYFNMNISDDLFYTLPYSITLNTYLHSMGLATGCLSIGKNGGIVTSENI